MYAWGMGGEWGLVWCENSGSKVQEAGVVQVVYSYFVRLSQKIRPWSFYRPFPKSSDVKVSWAVSSFIAGSISKTRRSRHDSEKEGAISIFLLAQPCSVQGTSPPWLRTSSAATRSHSDRLIQMSGRSPISLSNSNATVSGTSPPRKALVMIPSVP